MESVTSVQRVCRIQLCTDTPGVWIFVGFLGSNAAGGPQFRQTAGIVA